MSGLIDRKEIIKRARELRSNMPPAELKLWAELRCRQLDGLRFRRQHPIPPYIVDFYLPSQRLVIEVDGDSHDDNTAYEIRRTFYLEHKEYKILRFTNEKVYEDLAGVIERIRSFCGKNKETPTRSFAALRTGGRRPPKTPLKRTRGRRIIPPLPEGRLGGVTAQKREELWQLKEKKCTLHWMQKN